MRAHDRQPLSRRCATRFTVLAVACLLATAAHTGSAVADPVVYAAGDIACDPNDPNYNNGNGTAMACRQQATARLVTAPQDATAVLALGDEQYNAGSLANFQAVYDHSWGAFKSITMPVIGNHEGASATTGRGYCSYFGASAHCNASGAQGSAAFYSADVGDWHVVVINSNCDAAGGCGVGSPQYRWLQADLAAHQAPCTLAAWHEARWSSGYGGSNAFMQPIWQLLYDAGADLVLSGHSHDYERFAPLDGSGAVKPADGMRQFVVGTGGDSFTGLSTHAAAGSEVRQNTTFGVLRLVLHPSSFDWGFQPIAGRTFRDAGTQPCRALPPPSPPAPAPPAADATAPTAPTRLRVQRAGHHRVRLSWAASSDNVGVAAYEIFRRRRTYRKGSIMATSATAFTDTTLVPGRHYVYRVRARDAAANLSPFTAPKSVSTLPARGMLLRRSRLAPRAARHALARGRVRVRRRPWANTVIRVRVAGRVAGRRATGTRRAVTVRLASWSHRRRYRQRAVTVVIRRAARRPRRGVSALAGSSP
jgi:hypothetical protein